MLNISKESELSPNKLLNGSEIQFYPNPTNNNISTTKSHEYNSTIPTNKNIHDNNKPKKNNMKLIRPELDFLKIIKIKIKSIKEIITTKFDKELKDLHNNIKNKKLLLSIDILKSIESIKWKLIEEINDLEILSKDYEKKFNNILNHKVAQRNHSHLNVINATNISSFSNSIKRNSFSDPILPNSTKYEKNDKKIVSSISQVNKSPKLNEERKKPKLAYMNKSKSGTKINLNKSLNNKSYSEIKINLNNNKNCSNINDYIKNKKNKNSSILSNSNMEESICENNLINSYKNKIAEKEKELNYIKERLENEKLVNKNLLHELDKMKYNKSIQMSKRQFNQMINPNNSKNEELLVISNKLTKLIEMVVNFSYSMAHLRSNVFSKEKMKKNESIKNFENLSKDLKQLYDEFESINKNLKNSCGINTKNNESKNKKINQNKNNSFDSQNNIIIENKPKTDNINDIKNINKININEEKHNQENIKIYNSNNKYKEININSPIKEENSLEINNDEKTNIEEIQKN